MNTTENKSRILIRLFWLLFIIFYVFINCVLSPIRLIYWIFTGKYFFEILEDLLIKIIPEDW